MKCGRILVALLLAMPLVVLDTSPAQACSCAPATIDDLLARDEAVFVGEVTTVSEFDDEGSRTTSFVIDEWLKGPIEPETLELESGSGVGCGIELQAGDYVALGLSDVETEPRGSLCSYVGGHEAQASLRPLGVDAEAGPARLLLTDGSLDGPHLLALDEMGRIAGFAEPPPTDEYRALAGVDQCPGSTLVVESWREPQITLIRDLSTMEVVEELPGAILWAPPTCLDADAQNIRLAGSLNSNLTVWNPRTDESIVVEGAGSLHEGPDGSFYAVGFDIRRIDLDSGELTQVVDDSFSRGAISPDGSTFVYSTQAVDGMSNIIVTADGDSEPAVITVDGFVQPVGWMSETEVLFRASTPRELVLLDTATLTTDSNLPPGVTAGIRPHLFDGRLLSLEWGGLLEIDRTAGSRTLLAQLPVSRYASLTELDAPIEVLADLPIVSAPLPTVLAPRETSDPVETTTSHAPIEVVDDEVLAAPVSGDDDQRDNSTPLLPIVVAAVAVLGVAAVGARRVFRR